MGFWVGQKLVGRSMDESLQTQVVARAVPETREEKTTQVTPLDTEEEEQLGPRKESVKKKVLGADDVRQPYKEVKKKSTYFVLQIASYRERDRANKEARRWRDKDYRVKVRKVDLGPEKGVFYRVHLGEYLSVEEATRSAKNLAQKHGLRSYVIPIRD
ncbi:MAG: SPOR domain-containing protein [Deltaproteobacteria bacterium]|nr:SPOR domain-containing protein [Deltaproteobacteria bacterium]